MTNNAETKHKASHVGAPAVFALELACQHINEAFGGYGCYLVGSALERPDWRDVDVRFIMDDDEFSKLFPDAHIDGAQWENDPRWLILTTSITEWLRKQTGLPIDFQFQPQTFANKRHTGRRDAIGLRIAKREVEADEWIPVSEKLPEIGQWVLVMCGGVVQRQSARLQWDEAKYWEWADELADSADLEAVTYWRPLPYSKL